MAPRRALASILLPALAAGVGTLEGVQEALQRIAAWESQKYNCSVSIALRSASGSTEAASGFVDGGRRMAEPSDGYAFGSVTKVLTGASIMKLVSEGKLKLTDEVAPIVDPLLARMAVSDPDQGFKSLADLWGAENVTGTTLQDLLAMTSGLPDFDTATPCLPGQTKCVPTDPLRKTLYDDPAHSYGPTRLLNVPWVAHKWKGACNKTMPFMRKPFCYSSTNFMMLGLVLLASQQADAGWDALDQAAFLPDYLKGKLQFATSGAPKEYTNVHGFDRTTYNVPEGQQNHHDNWEVSGVFSGWTASDIVAPASAIADLTWEVYGPEHNILPADQVKLMVPGMLTIYGLATFNLMMVTGHKDKYGVAYGHLGATYGYQSVTAYFPELEIAMTVATNIETDYQEQPADTMCLAYNKVASMLLNRTISCEFHAGGYYSGGCKCDGSLDASEVTLVV